MRHLLNVSGLVIAASLLLTGAGRAPAALGHAYAHGDCAPWDGAALTITLQDAPVPSLPAGQLPPDTYPKLVVSLWMGDPPVKRWIDIPGKGNQSNGYIGDCRAKGSCQALNGRVWLSRRTGDRIEGEVHVPLPDKSGRERVFPFSAPILPYRALCG